MKCFLNDGKGASTAVVVLLILSIFLIFSGIAAIFAYQLYMNSDNDMFYTLDVKLDGASDRIQMSLTDGSPLKVSLLKLNIDGNMADISDVEITELSAGSTLKVDSPIDLIEDQEYDVKVVYKDMTMINSYYLAGHGF
ncbi:MAG: hypothetical protein ACMUFK_03585 [Thermoplasmatota archaeon]